MPMIAVECERSSVLDEEERMLKSSSFICPDSQSRDQFIADHHSITRRNSGDTLAIDHGCILRIQT
jgi:hypothetical protein